MAHSLKTVRYQDESRKILLQNENGPCPLLAAANALLLRGVITLPPPCIRSGVASIDDVVNMLAVRAIEHGSRTGGADISTETENHHEFQLDELLSIFPDLQFGMDVNPKFTAGPTGVEYTKNLTAFDMLGVELIHGWLLDPQDVETTGVTRNKTYNELVELVINGNEAGETSEQLMREIKEKERLLELNTLSKLSKWKLNDETILDYVQVEIEETDDNGVESSVVKEEETTAKEIESTEAEPPSLPLSAEDKIATEKELVEMRRKHQKLSEAASEGVLINEFLTSTSHQLTYHGLHELMVHIAEESLCVFFRNNHFGTMTKKDGILYLLVTDLGYSNVSEVVWEKMDAIDGDTEYADDQFIKPLPREELEAATGPTLSPEEVLAQSTQNDKDFDLAVALSKGTDKRKSQVELDEEEGRLMAVATEESLKAYNFSIRNDASFEEGKTEEEGLETSHDMFASGAFADNVMTPGAIPPTLDTGNSVDADRAMALALQSQFEGGGKIEDKESLILAQKLQEQEDELAAARAGRNHGSGSTIDIRDATTTIGVRNDTTKSGKPDKNCRIS
eukprot:CAMPEP_0198280744 /NCGR_PEP_ID=MMETSP1449-20131203/769_1 /TAXON_ID=420275 /ORGANISM="Attheya septentrionalis, Strain CCMP2084" /LENGTH=565 /DNA_ID=CAMNT_0043976203 /DNA_START=158 /DNA_END=1855 /DNA_ORIENTATION=-